MSQSYTARKSLPRTTIVVILLAGDSDTVNDLDALLYAIQSGVDQWQAEELPLVFCLYHRWDEEFGARTFHFPIERGTLQFTDQQLNLESYPPPVRRELQGDVENQVGEFLGFVRKNLPYDGPIRSIVGAHGFPGLGFNPSVILELADALVNLLSRPVGGALDEPQRERLQALLGRTTMIGSPPNGFRSKRVPQATDGPPGPGRPEVSLGQARKALSIFPQGRLQTLFLHTCEMSGLETISALADVPHHIACETALFAPVRFADWFSVLGDPAASDFEITLSCFKSLTSLAPRNADGCFSSHRTKGIDSILCDLNTLGDRLYELITQGDDPAIQKAFSTIRSAREDSAVSNLTVDIVQFCISLNQKEVVPNSLTQPIVDGVCELQFTSPVKSKDWQRLAIYDSYRGISVYLPQRRINADSTSVLPDSFQNGAPRWCRFVDAWLK